MTTATHSGRHRSPAPARASRLAGTGTMIRLALRRDRFRLPIWIAAHGLLVLYIGSALPQLAPTKEDLTGISSLLSQPVGRMFTGPAFGMDANMVLAWHKYGGGKELLAKLYDAIGGNVVSFLTGPMPTQPFGWFKKPITKTEDLKGLKFRTNGLAIDLFTEMGAAVNALPGGEIVPALDRGLLDGA